MTVIDGTGKKNRYKIDWHKEYDRVDKPYGVYVRAGLLRRWQYICCFKSSAEAEAYVFALLELPREIYRAA
jgi:hypothetical protein